MGLKNNQSAVTYLNFKDGKFFKSEDKEKTNPFSEVEGKITGLNLIDDDYQGNVLRKLVVRMTDGEDNFSIKFSFDSAYASSFVGFLKNADVSETLSLVGVNKPTEDGKNKIGLLVKQNDVFLKSYYSKDEPNGLPPMVKIMVNKKPTWDKTDMSAFLEDVVLNDLAKQVTNSPVSTEKKNVMADVEDDTDDSDLPF